jgi:hypothetical protein
MGWPDVIGFTDASKHVIGGVLAGENLAVPPGFSSYHNQRIFNGI